MSRVRRRPQKLGSGDPRARSTQLHLTDHTLLGNCEPRVAVGCAIAAMYHDPFERPRFRRTRGARGLLADHQPLNPNLSVASEFLHDLRLVAIREEVRTACRCIVANALLAHWQGDITWVFYSRDNTHYAAVRAGVPSWYSRSIVAMGVDQLVARGLLEERRTVPSPSAQFRSSFRATPNLIQAVGPIDISHLRWKTTPPVRLHSRDDRRTLDPVAVLSDLELAEFADIGADVEAHNTFMSAFDIRLQPGCGRSSPLRPAQSGQCLSQSGVTPATSRLQW